MSFKNKAHREIGKDVNKGGTACMHLSEPASLHGRQEIGKTFPQSWREIKQGREREREREREGGREKRRQRERWSGE